MCMHFWKAHTRHRMIKTRSKFTGDRVLSALAIFCSNCLHFLCNTGDLMVGEIHFSSDTEPRLLHKLMLGNFLEWIYERDLRLNLWMRALRFEIFGWAWKAWVRKNLFFVKIKFFLCLHLRPKFLSFIEQKFWLLLLLKINSV